MAIKVDSAAQEYLYVARLGCSCGGQLRPTGPALLATRLKLAEALRGE